MLKKIKLELSKIYGKEVGHISKASTRDSATYSIGEFEILRDFIVPLFMFHSLRTNKALDFKDWSEAINIRNNSAKIKDYHILSEEEARRILDLKNRMNSNRSSLDPLLISDEPINPCWLVGFVEGDGSFNISKYLSLIPVFSLSQHKKDRLLLEKISILLKKTPFRVPDGFKASQTKTAKAQRLLTKFLKKETSNVYGSKNNSVLQIKMASQYFLLYHLVDYFEKIQFFSRKYEFFQLWGLTLKLIAAGALEVPEGKDLIKRIAINMNNANYSNSKSKPAHPMPSEEEINSLISKVNALNLDYEIAQFSLKKSEEVELIFEKPEVWAYDQGVLVHGSPFKNKKQAARAIGKPSGLITVDTGRPYLNRFTFFSKPSKALESNLIFEPKLVYCYDLGQLVEGSPFATLNQAARAIGKGTASGITVDTGRVYLKRYTFFSKPQSP